MPEKVPHPTMQFAYRCTTKGCTAEPYRWRDQAQECERNHELRRQWTQQRQVNK